MTKAQRDALRVHRHYSQKCKKLLEKWKMDANDYAETDDENSPSRIAKSRLTEATRYRSDPQGDTIHALKLLEAKAKMRSYRKELSGNHLLGALLYQAEVSMQAQAIELLLHAEGTMGDNEIDAVGDAIGGAVGEGIGMREESYVDLALKVKTGQEDAALDALIPRDGDSMEYDELREILKRAKSGAIKDLLEAQREYRTEKAEGD